MRSAVRRPRYQLLADHLIEQITSGELPVGARIPSEYELCAEHEMSRGTVRQALRGLEDLGMISRSPTGTTVTAPRPVDAYHPSASTPDEIMDLILRTKLRRPTSAEVIAAEATPDEAAAALDVPPGSPALTVRRTHDDAIGQLGTISIHTHRGDRYRIRTTFHPDDTGGL
jgi:GntR family transcriptional regulator